MSELRVDSVKSKGGGAPDLPKGVNISGITTAATLGATTVDVSNVNVSGVVTSGTLSGELLSTGTPTLGLGVTINSSGLHITGVATAGIVSATTLYGDGTNVTGVGASIAPLFYNPDPYDTGVTFATGIGITFNSQVKAGSGEVTLRLVGAAGTVVENFGVGSSVSISENRITIDPTADLSQDTVYHLSYPSGCFTNNEGTDYVGTAYTFETRSYSYQLWQWGEDEQGQVGNNNRTNYSSPIQIPGTTWTKFFRGHRKSSSALRSDNTLWVWGYNNKGQLGQNDIAARSSPVQLPGTTWNLGMIANSSYWIRTDGTLWAWGYNAYGGLGHNSPENSDLSSPVQIPGTTWSDVTSTTYTAGAFKTDGTLWTWGANVQGNLGQNNTTNYSSPVQVPGTTWTKIEMGNSAVLGTKTDGTLWSWGYNGKGQLGQNNTTKYSSPTQIPGTTWSTERGKFATDASSAAIKTDGTLWTWGRNDRGSLGQNSRTYYSSPVQIPGTTWQYVFHGENNYMAVKTDGTLWTWGQNDSGQLAHNNVVYLSSPTQVGSDTTWDLSSVYHGGGNPMAAFKKI